MKTTQINSHVPEVGLVSTVTKLHIAASRTFAAVMLTIALFAFPAMEVSAQRRSTTQNFPARSNVRLELRNLMGSITIEAWDRDSVQVIIDRENPPAQVSPQMSGDTLIINVRTDQNTAAAGDVNFRIRVPVNSLIDVETVRGDIIVRNVRSQIVRAVVTTEGDVQLTGIRATTVMARNMMGLIVFEGELLPRGTYSFTSMSGQMHLRIPSDSGFNLTALTRSIDLGSFARHFTPRGHRVTGNVGDGGATLSISNTSGSVSFMR